MAKLWWQRTGKTLAVWTGKHKRKAFPVAVAVGSDRLALGKGAASLCYTDLARESIRFYCVLQILGIDNGFIFHEKWNDDGVCKNMLQTKAALIASLSLSIIHWSLSKN